MNRLDAYIAFRLEFLGHPDVRISTRDRDDLALVEVQVAKRHGHVGLPPLGALIVLRHETLVAPDARDQVERVADACRQDLESAWDGDGSPRGQNLARLQAVTPPIDPLPHLARLGRS